MNHQQHSAHRKLEMKLERYETKRERGFIEGENRLQLAAIGLESEFSLFVNEKEAKPERIFGSPKTFLLGRTLHRGGSSYHLPTGGAVYFDTGVVEVATPVIELSKRCCARAGRSLWESILQLRTSLDAWEQRTHNDVRLAGFSTHYNISFDLPHEQQGKSRTVYKLAYLLAHVLPAPVMLLAANKRSTGIGVRPRGDRIEITADFTPSPALMIATATLITGIVRAVMTWESFELPQLRKRGLPRIVPFKPIPHTSRQGWLAKMSCYELNPFEENVDEEIWSLDRCSKKVSLRAIAQRVFEYFWRSIGRISDPFTYRLIRSIFRGDAPSLLELSDRPEEYHDVGRLCRWDNLFPETVLDRSRYEQVLIHAIAGDQLHINGEWLAPMGMQGWARVVFQGEHSRERRILSIDYLTGHLRQWGRGVN